MNLSIKENGFIYIFYHLIEHDLTAFFKGVAIQVIGGYFMNIFDIDYNKKEKDLFKYHYTFLLSELLILNYEFFNTGQDAFYNLQKKKNKI